MVNIAAVPKNSCSIVFAGIVDLDEHDVMDILRSHLRLWARVSVSMLGKNLVREECLCNCRGIVNVTEGLDQSQRWDWLIAPALRPRMPGAGASRGATACRRCVCGARDVLQHILQQRIVKVLSAKMRISCRGAR